MRVTHSPSFPDPALREARPTRATGAELRTMNLRGGSVVGARSAEAGTWFGARVGGRVLRLLMVALAAWWPQGATAGGETPVRAEAVSPSPDSVGALYAHLPL